MSYADRLRYAKRMVCSAACEWGTDFSTDGSVLLPVCEKHRKAEGYFIDDDETRVLVKWVGLTRGKFLTWESIDYFLSKLDTPVHHAPSSSTSFSRLPPTPYFSYSCACLG